MKAYTDLEQSKILTEILPLESADMRFCFSHTLDGRITGHYPMIGREPSLGTIPCWSLNALIELLPEIKGTPFVIQKFKTENNNYYNLEYEGIIMLPYCKSLVDGCVEMIEKLKKENLI